MFVLTDLAVIVLSYVLVLALFPLTSQEPFEKYHFSIMLFTAINLVVGLFLWKYSSTLLCRKNIFARIIYSNVVSNVLFIVLIQKYKFSNLSINVLLLVSAVMTILEFSVFMLIYIMHRVKEDKKKPVLINPPLSKSMPAKQYEFVSKYVPEDAETNVHAKNSVFEVMQMEPKKCFVHSLRFNKVDEPNLFLAMANQKIEDGGYFIGHFETKNARKKRILDTHPFPFNYIYYVYDFFYKRFFPSFYLTAPFFSQLYNKIDTVYSKTEVYGRFYCAGFMLVKDCKIDGNTNFIFRKVGKPQRYKESYVGMLIGLNRIGKGGKKFVEYKLRTMYPYSEYLQSYMISQNSLREGGKIRRDVRITRFGAISRRLWLDELPQIINLIKGDIKLVGVRPLSTSYFKLYDKELQRYRIKFKPGMLPPFYADMPKTLDEIQASEMKYLKACEENGTFKTDIHYLCMIFNNIVFKSARSH